MALTMVASRWSKNRVAPVQPDLAAELIAAIDNGDLIFTRPDGERQPDWSSTER